MNTTEQLQNEYTLQAQLTDWVRDCYEEVGQENGTELKLATWYHQGGSAPYCAVNSLARVLDTLPREVVHSADLTFRAINGLVLSKGEETTAVIGSEAWLLPRKRASTAVISSAEA